MLPDLLNLPLRQSRVNNYCPCIEPAQGKQEHSGRHTVLTDDHYSVTTAYSQLVQSSRDMNRCLPQFLK
jgi:hypothetical protein